MEIYNRTASHSQSDFSVSVLSVGSGLVTSVEYRSSENVLGVKCVKRLERKQ